MGELVQFAVRLQYTHAATCGILLVYKYFELNALNTYLMTEIYAGIFLFVHLCTRIIQRKYLFIHFHSFILVSL